MPAAGKYRTPIAIEQLRAKTGPSGAARDEWSGWLQRRCKLRLAGVRDQQQIDTQNTVLISHVVELRRDSQTATILQDMRIRVLGRVASGVPRILHIESIVEADELGQELHLRCTERSVPQ